MSAEPYDPVATARALAERMRRASRSRRSLLTTRIATLVTALDPAVPATAGLVEQLVTLDRVVGAGGRREVWFAVAVLGAALPVEDVVVDTTRRARVEGTLIALEPYLTVGHGVARLLPALRRPAVEVVTDQTLVDVDHTSRVVFATGIQRVVRETAVRWDRMYDLVFVGWTGDRTALRRLTFAQYIQALTGAPAVDTPGWRARLRGQWVDRFGGTVIVPRGGRYVLPELSLERTSLMRVSALAQFSGLETAAIGFDAVPISSSETVNFLVSGGFASYLSALKHMDRVATISDAAEGEYRGWRQMLAGTGLPGPTLATVPLPATTTEPTDPAAELMAAEREYCAPDLPLVVCVGSHEPRKNHLAVLHSAELLWREGHRFALLFVGGNSWNSYEFTLELSLLRDAGRPIRAQRSATDGELWAIYQLARFTVFPSLNEGYGLPVAESLAAGTPVITSAFGATADLAQHGGALTVDPHNQAELTGAMRRLIEDDELCATLRAQAGSLPQSSWDRYARDTWSFLVGHG